MASLSRSVATALIVVLPAGLLLLAAVVFARTFYLSFRRTAGPTRLQDALTQIDLSLVVDEAKRLLRG